ncbi:MAG: transglycosylase domain-containing protein [Actinobacteria bacterium]|nr:transglycosylase domain-containing protein [Actinomycetota bacterium]
MSHRQRQLRKRRHQRRPGRIILLALGLLVCVALIAALSVVGYVFAIADSAPNISELKPIDKGATSVVYAGDGSQLGFVSSDIIRTPIAWGDMPDVLRQATVAIEDKRFYHHGGVDFNGILRAGIKNVTSGKTVQGGSTITQQLVRELYIKDPKRDLARKIREAKMADELEKSHSKRWILHEYLNDVPYGTVGGRTAIGIEAASEIFFDAPAQSLNLVQAALLAGLPQAPSEYNPFRNPAAAMQRRNDVLRAMAAQHFISQADASAAEQQPLGLRHTTRYDNRREPYFFDYVQDQLITRYGVNVFRRGGLKVYTTVDPKLQDEGRQAIASTLPYRSDPASAIVSIDPQTGYIKAMASSGTYQDRAFNLAAQGHRQPGSSFKTFVLTTALRQGVDPNTTIYVSKPLSLNVGGQRWNVKTYDGTYGGPMNIVDATLKSDNTVYAQLDLDVGPKSVAQTAHLLGIRTHLDGIPAEGLGGLRLGVSPLEMASAYATLAAGGVYSEPKAITKVVFPDGKTDDLGQPSRKRVIPDSVAYEVTHILEMNVQRGTGKAANYGCPAAGKTGTTDNYNDAWFVGYTPTMSSAVWVGYPNAQTEMRDVHGIEVAGGTFPAQIWHDYMSVGDSTCTNFPKPKHHIQYQDFQGAHSVGQSGGSSPSNIYPGGGAGGGNYYPGGGANGYNPQFYAAPPQGPPPTVAPPTGGGAGGGAGGGGAGGPAGIGGGGTGAHP